MLDLTEQECINSVKWAIAEVSKISYRKDSWNHFEFLIKEHSLGYADAAGTAYKCKNGFNIDFDIRCTFCGTILVMGSIDIEGSVHDEDQELGPVVIARGLDELAEAIGSDHPSQKLNIADAGRYMWRKLKAVRVCCCF